MELSWPQGQGKGDMEALEWAGELGGARTPRFNRKLSHQAFLRHLYMQLCRQAPRLFFTHRGQRAHICRCVCTGWGLA